MLTADHPCIPYVAYHKTWMVLANLRLERMSYGWSSAESASSTNVGSNCTVMVTRNRGQGRPRLTTGDVLSWQVVGGVALRKLFRICLMQSSVSESKITCFCPKNHARSFKIMHVYFLVWRILYLLMFSRPSLLKFVCCKSSTFNQSNLSSISNFYLRNMSFRFITAHLYCFFISISCDWTFLSPCVFQTCPSAFPSQIDPFFLPSNLSQPTLFSTCQRRLGFSRALSPLPPPPTNHSVPCRTLTARGSQWAL